MQKTYTKYIHAKKFLMRCVYVIYTAFLGKKTKKKFCFWVGFGEILGEFLV